MAPSSFGEGHERRLSATSLASISRHVSAALNEGCRIASITANHRHSAIHCNLAPRGGGGGRVSACGEKLQDNGKRGFGGPDACRPDRALITRVHYCVRVQSASWAIGLKVSIIVTEFASRTETTFSCMWRCSVFMNSATSKHGRNAFHFLFYLQCLGRFG